ncbi:hypothetical protein GCM10020258_60300 [Sphingomonas yabuuchiae]
MIAEAGAIGYSQRHLTLGQQRDAIAVSPKEFGLARTVTIGSKHANIPASRLESVAYGTIADQPYCQGLIVKGGRHLRAMIHDTACDQHRACDVRADSCLRDKAARHDGDTFHLARY